MSTPTGGLRAASRRLGKMSFAGGGREIQWFPGHMFAAIRAIRDRLKLADLVIEVRDARIPLSSANEDLQTFIAHKRRVIALNKKDLANPNVMHKWIREFDSKKLDCIAVNARVKNSVKQLLALVELKLKEAISREPTLLVMVVGVPNVGKSVLINAIHQIAISRFPVPEKIKRATVGPLPGVTQDIAGYKIANHPSIYVLDTPGVLVPRIRDMETGLKLALTGAVKDSVVGEERLAQYLLAVLNTRGTPLHWRPLFDMGKQPEGSPPKIPKRMGNVFRDSVPRSDELNYTDVLYVEGVVKEVMHTLFVSLSEHDGSLDDDCSLESLIDAQLTSLRKPFKVVHKSSEVARTMVSKKLLTLFRTGKLGPFILDDVPSSTR